MTRSARQRLVAFAAGLTLLVGLLTGVVSALTYQSLYWVSLNYLASAASGLAARLGARYVELVGLFGVLALYVALPFAVAYTSSSGDDRRPAFHYAWAVAAVSLLPVLVASVAFSRIGNPYMPLERRLVGVVIPVSFLVGLFAAHRLTLSRSPDGVDGSPPLAVFANVAFLVLFLGGFLLGGVAGAGPAGALVETERLGPPQTDFEFSEAETDDGTVLVVTHGGGEAVPAERLRIAGEGFANVSGVDRSGPGGWPTSAATDRPDGPTVTRDDSVTVGVADDCDIRVVYVRGDVLDTLDRHDCGGE